MRYRDFADECRLLGVTLRDKYTAVFYLPMPATWSQKKRAAMNGQPHQQKPDLDNLIKALQDAALSDDSSEYSVFATKRWAESGAIEIYDN